MQLKKAIAIMSGMGVATAVSAGNLTSATGDITFSGGATAGYFYNTKTGSNKTDSIEVPDVSLNFSSDAKARGVGFNVVTGRSQTPTIMQPSPSPAAAGALSSSPEGFNVFVADFSVAPVANLTLNIGKLPTNIGYEIAPTFANPNVLLGAVWAMQPVTYPGARATYNLGAAQVYAEVNKDTSTNGTGASVLGVMTSLKGVNLTASYYNAYNGRNIVDVIASYSMDAISFAANIDYHTLDTSIQTAGNATKATGMAFYVTPKMGKIALPVRVESLSDGTSGIYGVDNGYSVTVTPTYSLSDSAFVRA
ncbi:MAG: porin, partial [Gammaproteobacteria bacterium]|nr:porin [Gammaproteobacteria bacterium]